MIAEASGLADVVGALPKYQNQSGHYAKVVIPAYNNKFFQENEYETVHQGQLKLGWFLFSYSVVKEKTNKLGFELYQIAIPELFDRPNVYSYEDDTERFLSFQIAFLNWLTHWEHHPDIIHCHDHHTGLVPFMIKHCYQFKILSSIPTIFTIHNAQYQGWMDWDKTNWLPNFDPWK